MASSAFANQGYDALVAWLNDRGVRNIAALNQVRSRRGAVVVSYGGESTSRSSDMKSSLHRQHGRRLKLR